MQPKKGIKKAAVKVPLGEFIWYCERVRMILTNQSYVGDVIDFKTYSKSFKLKKGLKTTKKIEKSIKWIKYIKIIIYFLYCIKIDKFRN